MFEKTLAQTEGRLAELKSALQVAHTEHETLGRTYQQLSEAYDTRGSEVARLETLCSSLSEQLTSTKTDLGQVQQALSNTRGLVAQREGELSAARAEAHERSGRLEDGARRVQEIERQAAQLQKTLDGVISERERLLSERQVLQESVAHSNTKAQQQHERIVGLEQTIVELKNSIHNYEKEAQKLGATQERLENELGRSDAQGSQLSEKLASVNQTFANYKEKTQEELTALDNEKHRLTASLDAERRMRQEEGQHLRSTMQEYAERVENLQSHLATLQSEKKSLGDQRRSEGESFRGKVAELESRITDGRAEHDRLEQRIKQIDALKVQAEQQKEELESQYIRELEDVHDAYMRKAQEVDAAHSSEIEQLRAATLDARRALKTSQLQVQRLTERVRRLETSQNQGAQAFEAFVARSSGSSRRRPAAPINSQASLSDDFSDENESTDSMRVFSGALARSETIVAPPPNYEEEEGQDEAQLEAVLRSHFGDFSK